MTQDKDGHTGGCLCGAVRYRAAGAPDWVGHCHCRSCRRNSGAAMLTFAGYTQDRITWTEGERQIFESSPGVRRGFCGRCGTPITYEADSYGDEVHLTIGTLDAPEALAPTLHVWTEAQLPWLHMADGLPRHEKTPGRD